LNRRDFVIRTGAAAAGLGIARAALALAPVAPGAGALRTRLRCEIVVDRRFAACRSFAVGAARLGCPVRSVSGDVTALWFNDLRAAWARGEGTLVGMTTGTALFCLEQLARDHWMRVTARIDHRIEPDGTLSHRLWLQEPTLREAAAVIGTDRRWPERLAGPLVNGLGVGARSPGSEKIILTPAPGHGELPVPLVTWAISARQVRALAA
jgi:hypothetical protein